MTRSQPQPQPQPSTTNCDMSQAAQDSDSEYLMNTYGQVVDSFYEYNQADMEGSNRGMDHALLAILSQEVNLDDFDPSKIDFESLNANALLFPGMYGSAQEQAVNQHQRQPCPQELRSPSVYANLRYACSAAFGGNLLPNRQVPQQACRSQVLRGDLKRPNPSPRSVQLPYAQEQTSWIEQESPTHGLRVSDVKPQWLDAYQSATSQSTAPSSPELQSKLQYPGSASPPPFLPRAMATGKGTFTELPGEKKQKRGSETPQSQPPALTKVPVLSLNPTATTASEALQFASVTEAQQAAATRLIPHNYAPPADDETFPKDQEARKSYIRQLYDAYVDITHCIDRATVSNFDSHFASLSCTPSTSPITPYAISTICWHLLSIAIDLHTRGPICLDVYDPAKLKNVYKYRKLKFSERINKVCELLKMSKARCGSLLRLDGLGMVVATAPALCRQTKSNYMHNGRRQNDLVVGKNVVAGKKRGAADMDGDEVKEEEGTEAKE